MFQGLIVSYIKFYLLQSLVFLIQVCIARKWPKQSRLLERNVMEFSVKREKNQQDATIRCLLSTSVSTCFGHHYTYLQENKGRVNCIWCVVLVLLDVVGSGCGALRCRMRAVVYCSCVPEQYTKCSNTAFDLLKIGIVMSETCWDRSW